MKHRRQRNVLRRTLVLVLGVTVVVFGAGTAIALTQRQDIGATLAPALSAPSEVSPDEVVSGDTRSASVSAASARRAQVMRASRNYQRTAIRRLDSRLAEAAARDAAARAQTITEQYEAADARSAEIKRAIERREARQRRIAWLNRWVVPVAHYTITATFGDGGGLWAEDHTGLDFAAPEGTPVMATAAGEVSYTTYDSSYGNQIVITHDDGTQTWYCHLSSFYVSAGDSVEPGTTIGAVGSTGNTTGPHLHLEVHPYGGAAVDPYTYLQARGAL